MAEQVLSKPRDKNHQSLNAGKHLEVGLMAPGSKENDQICNKNSTPHHKELEGEVTRKFKVPMVFQKSATENDKAPLTSQKSTTKSTKVPQSLKKGLADGIKEQTSQKRSKKAIQGPLVLQKGSSKNVKGSQTSPKQTAHLWPTVTLGKNSKAKEEPKQAEPAAQRVSECNFVVVDNEKEPVSESGSRQHVVQENVDKTEGEGSLENCPICLMQFPKQ